jgi:hypothetical protein
VLLHGDARNGAADHVESQVLQRFEADATFTHVELLAALLVLAGARWQKRLVTQTIENRIVRRRASGLRKTLSGALEESLEQFDEVFVRIKSMSLAYLKDAIKEGDSEKLIRYVRLHFGDGNEERGAKEINKAWIEALKPMLEIPATDREFILQTLAEKDTPTLAHLFFHLHFYFVARSGEWIHDGNL